MSSPSCPKDGSPCPTVTLGIQCHACGTVELRVVETSHAEEGIVRLRECRVCSCRIRTIEQILSKKPPGRGTVRTSYPDIRKNHS